MSVPMQIRPPYLLFLGDAADQLAAKTAQGLAHWRPEWCVGQLSLPDCNADLGLPELMISDAAAAGARTVVVGVANRGGLISAAWTDLLEEALGLGMDVAAGLHNRLADVGADGVGAPLGVHPAIVDLVVERYHEGVRLLAGSEFSTVTEELSPARRR